MSRETDVAFCYLCGIVCAVVKILFFFFGVGVVFTFYLAIVCVLMEFLLDKVHVNQRENVIVKPMSVFEMLFEKHFLIGHVKSNKTLACLIFCCVVGDYHFVICCLY